MKANKEISVKPTLATVPAKGLARDRKRSMIGRSIAALKRFGSTLVEAWLRWLALSPMQDLEPGVEIGSYRLVRPLGAGGMGIVWEAQNENSELVALKLIHSAAWRDRSKRARASYRFSKEIEIASSITSDAVAKIYDSGQSPAGVPYFVMELVGGRNLREVVNDRGPMTPYATAKVLSQISRALVAVHRKGIVHRDIKPENLLLPETGAKLIDFGVATRAQQALSSPLTDEAVVVGTPQYIAPETLWGEVGTAADIYALGCVGYFLLTGEPAFSGPTPAHIMSAHLNGDGAKIPSTVPDSLASLLRRCLSTDPAARPSSNVLETAFAEVVFEERPLRLAS
jgi:serine/threonine protein kinase